MKTTFPKAKPKLIQYRNYRFFNETDFQEDLCSRLNKPDMSYTNFEKGFMDILDKEKSCQIKP